jgi:hypothetical protein
MKKGLRFLAAACLLARTASGQSDTTQMTILLGGSKAGVNKRWTNADGTYSEWFQYNDRGRGDSILTRYRLDEKDVRLSWKAMASTISRSGCSKGLPSRRGYEDGNRELLELQKGFEDGFYTGLTSSLSKEYGPGMAITGVTVFDSEKG